MDVITFLIALVAVVITAIAFQQVHATGRARRKYLSEARLKNHKRAVKNFLIALGFAILAVEIFVLSSGGRHAPKDLFYAHIAIDVIFGLSIALACYFNGLRNRQLHHVFVTGATIFSILVAITGVHLTSFNPLFR